MKRKARSKPETVTVGNVMVRIYKRQRATTTGKTRTVFEIADYTSGIRRLRGFTEHIEARKEAEKIARQLSTGDATAATIRNSEAASYGRAVELLPPTGASLDQVQRRKVADVVAELISAKQARVKSARYIGDLRARLTRFADSFVVDISSVTTADVQRWLDGLKLAPQTAKNFRTVLHTLFAFAESRGYVFKGGNPVGDTEKISANGGAIEIYTPEEITALLNVASRDFLPVLALGAFAGLRAALEPTLPVRAPGRPRTPRTPKSGT